MKPTSILAAEHAVVVYFHSPESGVGLDDILKPDYWTHVATRLRPGHRIEVLSDDGTYWAMLIVRAVGKHEAYVQALQHVALGQPAVAAGPESPFEVKWRGPARRFGVIRKTDKEIIKEDFQLREHAELWVKNHMNSMAA